jgi:hypothetical protein
MSVVVTREAATVVECDPRQAVRTCPAHVQRLRVWSVTVAAVNVDDSAVVLQEVHCTSEREREALSQCAALRGEVEELQAELRKRCAEAEPALPDVEEPPVTGKLEVLFAETLQLTEELSRLQTPAPRQRSLSPTHGSGQDSVDLVLSCALRRQIEALLEGYAQKESETRLAEEQQLAARASAREHTSMTERALREKAALKDKLATLERVATERATVLRQLSLENEALASDLNATEGAIRAKKVKVHKENRVRGKALDMLQQLQQKTSEFEQQRIEVTRTLESLAEAVLQHQRSTDQRQAQFQQFRRQLDDAVKAQTRTQTAAQRQADGLRMIGVSKQLLQLQASELHLQAASVTRMIQTVQSDLDACRAHMAQAAGQRVHALEEVTRTAEALLRLQAEFSEVQDRLLVHERRLKAVSSERNKHGQEAIDSKLAVHRSSLAVGVLHSQAERLKDSIAATDEHVLARLTERSSVKRELDKAGAELKRLQGRASEVQAAVSRQHAESVRLQAVINDGEAEVARQRATRLGVLAKRDWLADQLGSRTLAMRECYDQLKTRHRELQGAERRMRGAQREAHVLGAQLGVTLHELGVTRRHFASRDALKYELLVLGRDLLAQRARRAALAFIPAMNVHRFRAFARGAWMDKAEQNQRLHRLMSRKAAAIAKRTEEIRAQDAERRKLEHLAALREAGQASEPLLLACRSDLRDKASQLSALTAQLALLRTEFLHMRAGGSR